MCRKKYYNDSFTDYNKAKEFLEKKFREKMKKYFNKLFRQMMKIEDLGKRTREYKRICRLKSQL